LCWKIDDGDVAEDVSHEETLCQKCSHDVDPVPKKMRLDDVSNDGESCASAPSYEWPGLPTTIQQVVFACAKLKAVAAGRCPVSLGAASVLSFTHGFLFIFLAWDPL
jgi:hypothetical protein